MTSRDRHDATLVAVAQRFTSEASSAVLTPQSGIRVAAPSRSVLADREECTLFDVVPLGGADADDFGDDPTTTFIARREPATEPHLVAASPFDDPPARGEWRSCEAEPLSETRLEVAPPVSSSGGWSHHTGLTLCSRGVVRVDDGEPTAVHFPHVPPAKPTSVAVVAAPRPLFGWALSLSEVALNMTLAIGRFVSRR